MAIDRKELLAEFPPEEVEVKAQTVKGNECLVVPYLNARQVQKRLTDVFGVTGWSVTHQIVPVWIEKWEDGKPVLSQVQGVKTTLTVIDGEQAAIFEDFGYPNGGEQTKGAASDGLKRAAVPVGIGQYLYAHEGAWVPYDTKRKKPVVATLAELREDTKQRNSRASRPPARKATPPEEPVGDGSDEKHYCSCGNLLTTQDMEDCASLKIPPSCASCRARAAGGDPSAVCSASGCGKDLTAKEQAFCKSRDMSPLCFKHQREQ